MEVEFYDREVVPAPGAVLKDPIVRTFFKTRINNVSDKDASGDFDGLATEAHKATYPGAFQKYLDERHQKEAVKEANQSGQIFAGTFSPTSQPLPPPDSEDAKKLEDLKNKSPSEATDAKTAVAMQKRALRPNDTATKETEHSKTEPARDVVNEHEGFRTDGQFEQHTELEDQSRLAAQRDGKKLKG